MSDNKQQEISEYHNELFGENTYIFSPEDDPALVQQTLDDIYAKQEANQFGKNRYAIYFLPGEYDDSVEVHVGFYMQVAGLGIKPTDTSISKLACLARWLSDDPSNYNATCNFWRSVENMEMRSNTVWAVSQATDMRRVQVDGTLALHDNYGWCSGGFLSDSRVTRMIDSGTQQQWLSRNNGYPTWLGDNWNLVFLGDEQEGLPTGTWPALSYTVVDQTEIVREKPFLVYDEKDGFGVFVPSIRKDSTGISWESGEPDGSVLPISDFYVAKPDADSAETINAALEKGKHLLLTPGIYELSEPIRVQNENTVVLGMGLATLHASSGNVCMETADVGGLILAGILFDAGSAESENLLVIGAELADGGESGVTDGNPISVSDLYFRVGGADPAAPAKVKTCVTIQSDHVIGDNLWVWRADHGDQVAWDKNTTKNGIIINGDDVYMYALMVEHFHEYQTVWNGNNGKVIMYQSEVPYDVADPSAWMSHDGDMYGYASFYVDEKVHDFEGTGLGIYLYNRDGIVRMHTAMEVPDAENVSVHHIITVMLNGYPGMEHVVNDAGDGVLNIGQVQKILDYCDGEYK